MTLMFGFIRDPETGPVCPNTTIGSARILKILKIRIDHLDRSENGGVRKIPEPMAEVQITAVEAGGERSFNLEKSGGAGDNCPSLLQMSLRIGTRIEQRGFATCKGTSGRVHMSHSRVSDIPSFGAPDESIPSGVVEECQDAGCEWRAPDSGIKIEKTPLRSIVAAMLNKRFMLKGSKIRNEEQLINANHHLASQAPSWRGPNELYLAPQYDIFIQIFDV